MTSTFRIAMFYLLSASPALAADAFLFPIEQWGKKNLIINESTASLESLYRENIDNFERVGVFSSRNLYRAIADPIGRLDIKVKTLDGNLSVVFCTASIVSPNYILTNNHCINSRKYEVAEVSLLMGYISEVAEDSKYFNVSVEPVESDVTLDYAILEVQGKPSKDFGVIDLRTSNIGAGEELFIIHHPIGQPSTITRKDCRLTPRHKKDDFPLRHRCDTQPGSSGAPVFSDISKRLVAIHYAGGLTKRVASSANKAININQIIATSPILSKITGTKNSYDIKPASRTDDVDLGGDELYLGSPVDIYERRGMSDDNSIHYLPLTSFALVDSEVKLEGVIEDVSAYEGVNYYIRNTPGGRRPYVSRYSYAIIHPDVFLETEGCLIKFSEITTNVDPISLEEEDIGVYSQRASGNGWINLASEDIEYYVRKQPNGFKVSLRGEQVSLRSFLPRYLLTSNIDFMVDTRKRANRVLRSLGSLSSSCRKNINTQRTPSIRQSLTYRTSQLAESFKKELIGLSSFSKIDFELCKLTLHYSWNEGSVSWVDFTSLGFSEEISAGELSKLLSEETVESSIKLGKVCRSNMIHFALTELPF